MEPGPRQAFSVAEMRRSDGSDQSLYKLKFFHKCRSPDTCDQGQIDRLQVQNCALEASCGAVVLVVLVRFKDGTDTGLAGEGQRAYFAPGPTRFWIKGRNVLGGPDVSPDGQIYLTPLEQAGIAYLDNWSCVNPPATHLAVKRGSSSAGWGGGTTGGSSGSAKPLELCLLVQLLKRNAQQRGRWDVFRMPHLISRPFQVLPRAALPVPMPSALPASLLQQQRTRQQMQFQQPHKPYERPQQLQQQQQSLQQQQPPRQLTLEEHQLLSQQMQPSKQPQQEPRQLTLEQHRRLALQMQRQKLSKQQQRANPSDSARHGLEHPGPGFAAASLTVSLGLQGGRQQLPSGQQQSPSGQQQLPGAAGVGTDFSPMSPPLGGFGGFGAGSFGGGEAGPGLAHDQDRRKSCGSGLTPKRSARPRRRSCLSKDSASHDCALGSPPGSRSTLAGSASRTVTPAGLAAMAPEANALRTVTSGSDAAGPLPQPLLLSGSARAMAPSAVDFGMVGAGDAGCNRLGLQQAPSATLLDSGLQELLEELEAHPLGADDLMELEGPQKRAKSNLTASEVAAFISDSSNSSLHTVSQVNQSVQQHLDAYLARGSNRSSISQPSRQYGSYSSGHSAGHSAELPAVRTQMAGFGGASFGSRDNTAGDPASPLDALMQQLQQPGAIQDALDRMALEQSSFDGGQRRSSGFDGMQG